MHLHQQKKIKTELGQYDLKLLDQIRDVILHKKGNETLKLYGTNLDADQNGSAELKSMFDDLVASQSNKLGGMLLKTYDSDIFNNWVQTDWIDGKGGITEKTYLSSTAWYSQAGLAVKTYLSDRFNNWLNTEWIDGTTGGINAITAIS